MAGPGEHAQPEHLSINAGERDSDDAEGNDIERDGADTGARDFRQPLRQEYFGVGFSLVAAVSFAVAALLVKVAAGGLSTLEILWGRGGLQIIVVTAMCVYKRTWPFGPPELWGWLSLRGLLGVLAVVGYFIGIISLPLADSIAIYSIKPVLAALLAAWFLSEPLNWIHGFSTVLSVAGCATVAHGEHSSGGSSQSGGLGPTFSVLLLVAAALLAASTSIVTRRIMTRSQVAAEVPVFYFCLMDVVVLAALTPLLLSSSFQRRTGALGWYHIAAVVGVAITSVMGQQFMTMGLKHVPSALATLLVQTETAWAFVLQAVIYHELSWLSLLGASMIAFASAAQAAYELRQARAASPSEGQRVMHKEDDLTLAPPRTSAA